MNAKHVWVKTAKATYSILKQSDVQGPTESGLLEQHPATISVLLRAPFHTKAGADNLGL
jgi:hypothetical protein